jgi:hypothetical protein
VPRKGNRLLAALGVLTLVAAPACSCGPLLAPFLPFDPFCLEAPWSNPPATLKDSDLVGTWQTHHDDIGVDRLIIKGDGTFKQIYEERVAYVVTLYRYETTWNPWWLERFPDGRVRIHLEGARYYREGKRIAELEGMSFGTAPLPWSFIDPFGGQDLDMVGKLVLNVRADRRGELLLHHMSFASDGGAFGIISCREQYFRRVETLWGR